jgi:hypothetical protein
MGEIILMAFHERGHAVGIGQGAKLGCYGLGEAARAS